MKKYEIENKRYKIENINILSFLEMIKRNFTKITEKLI
jgi:hypothetical protein